jgi:hypothetical protein
MAGVRTPVAVTAEFFTETPFHLSASGDDPPVARHTVRLRMLLVVVVSCLASVGHG